MMLKYKIDVMAALKAAGYNTTVIRRDSILSERTLTHIRAGEMIDTAHLDKLCQLLSMQIGDIIEYVPGPDRQ